MRKKYREQLYITLNLGCSGYCGICPTKDTVSCKCVTLESLIDWDKLQDAISKPEIKTITLFGGESPFINMRGHNIIFSKLINLIRGYRKELVVVSDYRGINDTGFVKQFSSLYIKTTTTKLYDVTPPSTWLKSYTNLVIYAEVIQVTPEIVEYLRNEYRQLLQNLIIITDGKQIPELKKEYPDLEFRGSLFSPRVKTYSISENKLYSSCKTSSKTWREKLKLE